MGNERKRILELVAKGTISVEEAIVLLEALTKNEDSTNPIIPIKLSKEQDKNIKDEPSSFQSEQQFEKKSKTINFEDFFNKAFNNKDSNKKMDEFVNDLKQDFSQFSQKMMGLMNSTFSKIKDFDLEFPFGEKIELSENCVYDVEDIKGLEIEIPNGKVEIEKVDGDQVFIEALVKNSTLNQDETNVKEQFKENFISLVNGKLNIVQPSKLSQVTLSIKLPEKEYDVIIIRLLNGAITISDLNAKLLKAKTYNGTIKINETSFVNANIETGNGPIELKDVSGEDVELETVNGKIFIDGEVKEIEAESVNGAVVITTRAKDARKLKAQTVAGAVEMYIPKSLSLDGQVTTNFGKADIALPDIEITSSEEQFLLKSLHFDKIIDHTPILKLIGESKTGTIIVRYNLD